MVAPNTHNKQQQ